MKAFKIIILLWLLFCDTYASGQASWHFSIWIKLCDKNGNTIIPDDFKSKRIKLFSEPLGTHGQNTLEYDTSNNAFKFSQSTIVTNSTLLFTCGTDTTIVEISTKDLYLDKVQLTTGIFDLRYWGNEKKFQCKKMLKGFYERTICYNKHNFQFYKTSNIRHGNLKRLIEVPLK